MPDKTNNSKLLPAYLVVGTDALKRRRVLERLKARLSAQGDLTMDSDAFSGDAASGAEIVAACNTLPFSSPLRLVTVRAAEKLRKQDSELLVDYLSSPCPSTVLLIECEQLARSTRLYKAAAKVGPQAVIDCAPPKPKDMPAHARRMATSHGIELSPGAAARLVDLVGTDTVELDSQLRKLALAHRGSDPVNEHEVADLVAPTAELKPWDLVDAFASRNLARCVSCLSRMPSASPHALLPQCTRRLRELICVRSLEQRGTPQLAAKELGKADWQVRRIRTDARRWSEPELRHALSAARDAEQAMKSGSEAKAAFVSWLAEVVPPSTPTPR